MHYSSLFQYFVLIYYGPYPSWKFLSVRTCLLAIFGNTIIMIMIEIQYRDGSREFKGFHEPSFLPSSDRPLTLLDKLLKILGKLESMYYEIITYHKIL